MTYVTSAVSHSEAAVQLFRAGAANPGRAAPDSAVVPVRTPDPRSGLSLSAQAADTIIALAHAQSQARAQSAGQHGSAKAGARAEAEAQASGGGSGTAEAHGSGSGEGSASTSKIPPPADGAAQALPTSAVAQEQTTISVSVEVQTVSITAQRPPKDVRDWWWGENAPDARRFLDAAYKRLGESTDTPRTLDDWCTKIGFLTLSRGTLFVIADNSSGRFARTEASAAQNALSVWDRVWGIPA